MTSDEFMEAATGVMTPAVEAVLGFALETAPAQDVGALVAAYMSTIARIALERVDEIIAEVENGHTPRP